MVVLPAVGVAAAILAVVVTVALSSSHINVNASTIRPNYLTLCGIKL